MAAIYYRELTDFDRSPAGRLKDIDPIKYETAKIDFLEVRSRDVSNHLLQSLAHLCHGRQKQIIVVIDNADQRDFETQQQAFLIAQEIASGQSCLVFIALRPSTFFVSKKRGALSGYQNRIFSISAPPADEVVQRRLTFALRVAEGRHHVAGLERIRFKLESIGYFLRATLRAIRENEEIRVFLNNISGGNIRSIVELITSFFGSPNVDSQKIVDIERQSGRYKIPLHEFTKHALIGDYSYYNPSSSLYACNVYDVALSDSREHFLKLLIIAYLRTGAGQHDRDGYVSGNAVLDEMLKLSFVETQSLSALKTLSEARLIETPHSHYREIPVTGDLYPESLLYRPTSIGLYHLTHWAGTFSFLDAMSIDTPIFDSEAREKIHALASSFKIDKRFTKASVFRHYFESCWYDANLAIQYFDFAALLKEHSMSFDRVKTAVHRA